MVICCANICIIICGAAYRYVSINVNGSHNGTSEGRCDIESSALNHCLVYYRFFQVVIKNLLIAFSLLKIIYCHDIYSVKIKSG